MSAPERDTPEYEAAAWGEQPAANLDIRTELAARFTAALLARGDEGGFEPSYCVRMGLNLADQLLLTITREEMGE